MLVPVSRATTHQPHVVEFGVTIDDEVFIDAVFVLAHLRFHDGLTLQGREPATDEFMNVRDFVRCDETFLRIWIDEHIVERRSDS